jgi:RNA polymerase sigma-70 factor (sigma-E family)
MNPEHTEEFRTFVMGSQGHLRRSAYVLCGDWHTAEDIVQTAYHRVYRAWHRVRVMDMPDAYARRVVYHCFLDSRKRQRESATLDAGADRPAPDGDPDTRLTILAALAGLAPRTRAVVALRYWEDQSVEQTAAVLGMSPGTVKSMAARGLAQLRERLGGDLRILLPDSTDTR